MKFPALYVGLFLFASSLVLAFYFRYNHFYEFTLIGLSLILFKLTKKSLFTKKQFLLTYTLFLIFGIILDLACQYFGFWKYSYQNIWEYLSLYFVIYPLGGIVMLQSYMFVLEKSHLRLKERNFNRKKIFLPILFLLPLMLAIGLFLPIGYFLKFGLLSISSVIFLSLFCADFITDRINENSYLRALRENLFSVGIVTLIATYANAFIHEFPNVFAKEWIYTIRTNTFLDIKILNILLLVWIGWILLSVGPVIIYYLIIGLFDKYRLNKYHPLDRN